MKQRLLSGYKTLAIIFLFLVVSILAFAQDKRIDIDIDVNGVGGSSSFFAQPLVWVVGGAIFILLLVALLKNSSSRFSG